ncbi:hypothetical protein OSB04_014024 [Centaurea solstitialis]|uniref:Uncharacterized protein n=1 Tax=Centaurea solstitialis TaxID=347529 RepID=A0AA38TEC7_9ASTR|nr:hypothetical protein OSB04_014024 [Centaurea solstitialis]
MDDQPANVLIQHDQEMCDTSDQALLEEMSDTSDQALPEEMSDTSDQALPEEMSDTSDQSQSDSSEQLNYPCGDLFDGRRRDYTTICIPLFQASIIGDWEAVEKILAENREFDDDLLGYGITEHYDTTLHMAVYSQNIKLVENLVNRMTNQHLVLQDGLGQTAFHNVATVGDVDMAKVMVQRCPQLLTIRNKKDELPIFSAGLYGKRNMVDYLYGKYKSMAGNDWTSHDIESLFYKCIEADLFDSALKILDDNNEIGFSEIWNARLVLYTLAQKTYVFKDMKSWKNSSKY